MRDRISRSRRGELDLLATPHGSSRRRGRQPGRDPVRAPRRAKGRWGGVRRRQPGRRRSPPPPSRTKAPIGPRVADRHADPRQRLAETSHSLTTERYADRPKRVNTEWAEPGLPKSEGPAAAPRQAKNPRDRGPGRAGPGRAGPDRAQGRTAPPSVHRAEGARHVPRWSRPVRGPTGSRPEEPGWGQGFRGGGEPRKG